MTPAPLPPLTLADVARVVGGTVVGDGARELRGISTLDRAGADELTFLSSARYAKELLESNAGAVLVTPDLAESPGRCANRVVVAKPHEAMLKLLPKFYRMPERPFVGVHPTAVVAPDAVVDPDACIEAFVVVGPGARVGKGSWIGPHCLVGDGVTVGADCRLVNQVTLYPGTVLGDRVILHAGARIGSDGYGYVFQGGAHQKIPHVGRCVLGNDIEIGANSTVDRGSLDATTIGDGTKIDNLVHIGHNCRVGRLVLMMAGVAIAGSARIEDGVVIAGQVGIAGHVTIGARATLAAQAGVIGDVPAGATWGGYPARPHKDVLRGYAAMKRLPELLKRIDRLLGREPDA
jgi:UDP-3-O-[3-hydroxymyristoyl] glucosamine N-acyltransferase